jgi:hypothetical protein
MGRVSSFVVALLVCLWTVPAFAQRTTGEISGRVVDESGAALPGVEATIHGAGVPGAPFVVTSETGAYRFPVLPAGSYEIEFALQGFASSKIEAIQVAVGQTVDLNLTLKISSVQETVTVNGVSPVVNVTTSESARTTAASGCERSGPALLYFDLINSAPGQLDLERGQSTSPVARNSTNGEPYWIDHRHQFHAVAQYRCDRGRQVLQRRLGRAATSRAVFSIVTRQGGAFHGDGNTYFQTMG